MSQKCERAELRVTPFSDVHGASFELEGDAMTSRSKNAGARTPSALDDSGAKFRGFLVEGWAN